MKRKLLLNHVEEFHLAKNIKTKPDSTKTQQSKSNILITASPEQVFKVIEDEPTEKNLKTEKSIQLLQKKKEKIYQELGDIQIQDIKITSQKPKEQKYFIVNHEEEELKQKQASKFTQSIVKRKQRFYGFLFMKKKQERQHHEAKLQQLELQEQRQREIIKQLRTEMAIKNIEMANERIQKRKKLQQLKKDTKQQEEQLLKQHSKSKIIEERKQKYKKIYSSLSQPKKQLFKNKFHKQLESLSKKNAHLFFQNKSEVCTSNQKNQSSVYEFINKKKQYSQKIRLNLPKKNLAIKKQQNSSSNEKIGKKVSLNRNEKYRLGCNYLQLAKQLSGFQKKVLKIKEQRQRKSKRFSEQEQVLIRQNTDKSINSMIALKKFITEPNKLKIQPYMINQIVQQQLQLNKMLKKIKI